MTIGAIPPSGVAVRTASRAALLFFVLTGCTPHAFADVRITLSPENGDQPRRFAVTGVSQDQLTKFSRLSTDEERREVLAVSVVQDDGRPAAAMLGSYSVDRQVIHFQPRFPLRSGVAYRATWRGEPQASAEFRIPRTDKTPPQILAVYPSGNVLPENQLKFYLHFSKPMQQGDAYRHVKLIEKSSGKEVVTPFLELGEELWDSTGKRFTLYFDPGRIKRGLQPRELFGPTLEAGKEYTLVVSGSWKDASARLPLGQTFRKRFKAVEPDQSMPNHRKWKVSSPQAGTKKPLRVELDEPLDHAMLHRVLIVDDPTGRIVRGEPTVSKQETVWEFTPVEPWAAGIHTLKIETTLEDRAGNSIGRPFEVDMIRPNTRQVSSETVTRRFRVSAPPRSP